MSPHPLILFAGMICGRTATHPGCSMRWHFYSFPSRFSPSFLFPVLVARFPLPFSLHFCLVSPSPQLYFAPTSRYVLVMATTANPFSTALLYINKCPCSELWFVCMSCSLCEVPSGRSTWWSCGTGKVSLMSPLPFPPPPSHPVCFSCSQLPCGQKQNFLSCSFSLFLSVWSRRVSTTRLV